MAELASSNRTPDTGMDIIIYNLLTSNNSQVWMASSSCFLWIPPPPFKCYAHNIGHWRGPGAAAIMCGTSFCWCIMPNGPGWVGICQVRFSEFFESKGVVTYQLSRSDTMITYATSIQDQPGMGIIATTYLKDQANCKEIIEDVSYPSILFIHSLSLLPQFLHEHLPCASMRLINVVSPVMPHWQWRGMLLCLFSCPALALRRRGARGGCGCRCVATGVVTFFFLSWLREWWDAVLQKHLGFVCFVVINPRVLSANRVDFGLFLFV